MTTPNAVNSPGAPAKKKWLIWVETQTPTSDFAQVLGKLDCIQKIVKAENILSKVCLSTTPAGIVVQKILQEIYLPDETPIVVLKVSPASEFFERP